MLQDGFGPETITFNQADLANREYHVVVNVFGDRFAESLNEQCFPGNINGEICTFVGGETVRASPFACFVCACMCAYARAFGCVRVCPEVTFSICNVLLSVSAKCRVFVRSLSE